MLAVAAAVAAAVAVAVAVAATHTVVTMISMWAMLPMFCSRCGARRCRFIWVNSHGGKMCTTNAGWNKTSLTM